MAHSLKTFLLTSLLTSSTLAAGPGKWSRTIQFPLVPVAGAVEPASGQLIVWSAYRDDTFAVNAANLTQTAVYNPADGSVKEFEVAYTEHDMFCPGISYDFNGNLLVTGGDTSAAVSLFQQGTWRWSKQAPMKKGRGYQSSATLSDGRIFTIGGSWSGARGGKDGEIWNGASWTLLPGCRVAPMLTADKQGIFRQDNHAWLFAWKGGSVLQAGPSVTMNWYTMSGQGSVAPAGQRSTNGDAMCGPAVMYDAVAGKILAVGGSPDYQDNFATANAHVLSIGAVNAAVQVQKVGSMSAARIFANSVVLPNGEVFVVGGQTWGNPFHDENSSLVPEIWSPGTQRWRQVAVSPTPRTYHSIALLMPNATVFVGGGGLCGNCGASNHFDGQLYAPPYLFAADGTTAAPRPQIASVSSRTPVVGASITVTLAAGAATPVTFSMVRMGSSTHTVNTDQRRVPLTASRSGNVYTIRLPSDPGILLPGYWYLFAMGNGVPSVAQIVQVRP